MRYLILPFLASCYVEAAPSEPVQVGGTCGDCDAVFEKRPAKLTSTARIAPATEPGEALVIDGIVRDGKGKPVAGVIVYAYHTNAAGLYPGSDKQRHGLLRGFAMTAKDGSYHFDTIRPGSYPQSTAPQHVHMHILEPARCHYAIDDIVFTDDPNLGAEDQKRRAAKKSKGGSGMVTPTRDAKTKAWQVRRDIALGANVDGYDRCR